MRTSTDNKNKFQVLGFIITFKKFFFLNIRHGEKGQSVLEYCLLLVVIAVLSMAIIWPHVSNSDSNIFTSVVDKVNQRVLGQ